MNYISPRRIVSTLFRVFKVKSKRVLSESERALIANTRGSIPLTAFNFEPHQIPIALYYLCKIDPNCKDNKHFYPLIHKFLTLSHTLITPSLTLPILYSIKLSRIVPKQSDIIHNFINSLLKPEITFNYYESIINTGALISLVDSIIGPQSVAESSFYNLKVVISQALDHYSSSSFFQCFPENSLSDIELLAALATLLIIANKNGLDVAKYLKTFQPFLMKINAVKFPKYTLIELLELSSINSDFDQLSRYLLSELSGFDNFGNYPRHLLQRVLLVAASKNWKNLNLLDNISQVFCETSHSNIGVDSIISWLESFKKLGYQNKSCLELLLRQSLSIKNVSDKYPIIYQLFRDLQFDHFLLSRLQVLTIHSVDNNRETIDKDSVSEINDEIVYDSVSKNSFVEKLLCNVKKSSTLKTSNDSQVKVKPTIKKNNKTSKDINVKLIWKSEKNRENILKFWKIKRQRELSRNKINDRNWRLLASGNRNNY